MRYQIILLILLMILAAGCKKTKTYPKSNKIIKKGTNEIINIDSKHEQIKTVKLYEIPNSYKNKKDILVDSLFLNVPSEGSIVKKYKKNRNELFTINSISSMNKYNYEIYYKSDSIFILKKTENYDRPLNMTGVKLANINREYALFVNDSLLQYVRNDTIKDGKKDKANELRNLLKILTTNN